MSNKAQFDPLVGGAESLPVRLDVEKFVSARCMEIQAMKNSLSVQSGTKLAFQKLPKHMRRRAMSHNVKRLPRRLREIHLNQMKKSGMPPKTKSHSRKYRRRPTNLMDDYCRRQNKHKWLRTHIWHAKRFHMIEKWGYRLPRCPCDKAFRACYRATAKHCLIQDISYFSCLELTGPASWIIEHFQKLTCPTYGYGIGAKAFSRGNREGTTTVFNMFQQPIGILYFLWGTAHDGISKLWLWSHAAFYAELLDTLINCFSFAEVIEQEKLYKNTEGLTLELRSDLSRFRLIGPLSTSILQSAFKLSPIDKENWLKDYIELNSMSYEHQSQYWNSLKGISAVSQLSPHIVLSLIVQDPRFNLPKKRFKAEPNSEPFVECDLPDDISKSPLWDEKFRCQLKNTITYAKIAELRSELLVPGSSITNNIPPVPVILIQMPGNRTDNIGYGSGWDVIIPSQWAQPIWLSLIMRGGRSGGLREADSLQFEMGKSDVLSPDTEAGQRDELEISQNCEKEFFKKPPNKRTNYNKLSIASPFTWNWKLLIHEWQNHSNQAKQFSVIRDKIVLKSIQDFITSKNNTFPSYDENSLIPVRITCLKKGLPKQFAIICLPEVCDFKTNPIEPICADKNQQHRNEMRRAHMALLKRLRKRRIRAKKGGQIIPIDKEILANYTMKMRELWLPQTIAIKNSCSRNVIGFIKRGGFNYAQGLAKGVGYIAFGALAALNDRKVRNRILFRNTDSRQYRLAQLNIIFE